MNKPTPGPWRVRELGSEGAMIYPDYGNIMERTRAICRSSMRDTLTDFANAALIVAAVNACFAVNPDNPLAVAEALPELVEIIKMAGQLERNKMLLDPIDWLPQLIIEEIISRSRAALAKLEAK